MGIPAGSPVSVATRHSPCDSPAVSNRSISQSFYGTRLEHLPFPPRMIIAEVRRGEVSALLCPAGAVLAAGAGRIGALSAGLAAAAAISHRGHRGGRRSRADLG